MISILILISIFYDVIGSIIGRVLKKIMEYNMNSMEKVKDLYWNYRRHFM